MGSLFRPIRSSSNGRTTAFGSVNLGSSPKLRAKLERTILFLMSVANALLLMCVVVHAYDYAIYLAIFVVSLLAVLRLWVHRL